jgi:hypothetical protein
MNSLKSISFCQHFSLVYLFFRQSAVMLNHEEIQTSEKPNLRNKGKRMGIKTGNTVKYDYYSNQEIKKTSTFTIEPLEVATVQKYRSSKEQSLNKNKAWEKIEKSKNDPNYIVSEEIGFQRNIGIQHKYKQKKEKTEQESNKEEEEEGGKWEIVQGRKGRTMKPKRTPGKKGVNRINQTKDKEDSKIETEAKYVVYVEKPQPKDSGMTFQRMHAKEKYYDYDFKNYKTKQRREAGENCQL